jgi:hypothetical protein
MAGDRPVTNGRFSQARLVSLSLGCMTVPVGGSDVATSSETTTQTNWFVVSTNKAVVHRDVV